MKQVQLGSRGALGRSLFTAALAAVAAMGCDVGKSSTDTGGAGGGGGGSGQTTSSGPGGGGQTTTSGTGGQGGGETTTTTTSSGTGGTMTAPGGYSVSGNTIYDSDGNKHVFHGIARPSTEWTPSGEMLSKNDFMLQKSWGATITRLSLNQDFWLPGAAKYESAYQQNIDTAITWAKQSGLDVILDLHWSDRGDLNNQNPGQQRMADKNSVTFWKSIAEKYKGDGRVLFELYNEPHDVSWEVWLGGGDSGDGFQVAGMQELYDAVRSTGADNLVIIGGLDYAYNLQGVPAHKVQGYNIVYASHPYDYPGKQPGDWEKDWGFLTQTDPVIVTEFGAFDCGTSYYSQLIPYMDQRSVSWTAWAWYPGGCGFPAVIQDWNGTPNAPGNVIKTALLSY